MLGFGEMILHFITLANTVCNHVKKSCSLISTIYYIKQLKNEFGKVNVVILATNKFKSIMQTNYPENQLEMVLMLSILIFHLVLFSCDIELKILVYKIHLMIQVPVKAFSFENSEVLSRAYCDSSKPNRSTTRYL